MSRKRKRQLYWMAIAALSIIALQMVTHQIVTIEFSYSENEPTEGTVIENEIPDDNDAGDEYDGNDGDNDNIGGNEDDGKDGETDNDGEYKVEGHGKVYDQDTEDKDYGVQNSIDTGILSDSAINKSPSDTNDEQELVKISPTTTNDQQNQSRMSSPASCPEIEGTALVHAYNDDDSYPKTAPAFVPLSKLFHGLEKTNKNDTAAICHYHCNIHFPHFIQEIVRCFSFWRSRPDQTPVLLVPRRQWNRFLLDPTALKEKSRFDYGIVEGLKEAIGLKIFKTYDGASVKTQSFLGVDHKVSPYSMRSRQDAIELRDIFVHMMTNQSSSSSSPSNLLKKEKRGHDQDKEESLRITFINRGGKEGRSILNADSILISLQEAFPQHQVVIQYFEDSSFEEQVELYSQSDVVIAPHGAQLTGIMFMPPCGAVLELFPHLYHTPYFFFISSKYIGIGTWKLVCFSR